MLEENDILEFARLWREEFKEELSPDAARHQATVLLELYALVYQPLGGDFSNTS
jgi:hypothetical protein